LYLTFCVCALGRKTQSGFPSIWRRFRAAGATFDCPGCVCVCRARARACVYVSVGPGHSVAHAFWPSAGCVLCEEIWLGGHVRADAGARQQRGPCRACPLGLRRPAVAAAPMPRGSGGWLVGWSWQGQRPTERATMQRGPSETSEEAAAVGAAKIEGRKGRRKKRQWPFGKWPKSPFSRYRGRNV
jgi:hypothetical protein